MSKIFNLLEFHERFNDINNQLEFISLLEEIAHELGFDYWAYGVRKSFNQSGKQPVFINNYPKAWNDIYKSSNYFKIDPTVIHGLRSTQMLHWNEDTFHSVPKFWEDVRSFDIVEGISLSQVDIKGRTGMLTFASTELNHSTKSLNKYSPIIFWLAQYTHQFLSEELLKTDIKSHALSLSIREQDILRWIAEGLTSYEIGLNLKLSESTIKYHIANILKKLEVPNKAAAINKSIRLHLIDP